MNNRDWLVWVCLSAGISFVALAAALVALSLVARYVGVA